MEKVDHSFWEWAFTQSGENPSAWYHSARELLTAADAVKEDVVDFGDSGMDTLAAVQAMLVGLAIESTLKGLWIEKTGDSLVKDGKYSRPKGVGGHDLVQWADAASVELCPTERYLLRRLSTFVVWAGRYPIPRTEGEMKPKKGRDRQAYVPQTYFLPKEIEQGATLCHRLLPTWAGSRSRSPRD